MKTLSKVLAITLGAAAFALTTATAAALPPRVGAMVKERHTAKAPNSPKEHKTTLKGRAAISNKAAERQ